MKKPTSKKLQLASERIRALTSHQLQRVAGGLAGVAPPVGKTVTDPMSNRPSCPGAL